ncbi:MAG: peptidoglycan editing factor PgeF [Candidatus Omnitrophica bacterium]|nr:peptidoglycan editing factor PgeF [Candidatus Omnitrophota bacterium]
MEASLKSSSVYQLDIFGSDVLVAFSGREFSNSRRKSFLKQIAVSPKSLNLLQQVHSANLALVTSDQKPDVNCKADGMLTSEEGVPLGILTADCVPIFFWDPDHRVIGIAHAGWRGILQEIAPKMIWAFRQNFASKSTSIRVIYGPAIRKCCYEVGAEFKELFPDHYTRVPKVENPEGPEKGYLDMIGAITDQLIRDGLAAENIHDTGICTSCQNDRFFSARREGGTSERTLSVIQILKK